MGLKGRRAGWLTLGALAAWVGVPYLLVQAGNLGLVRAGRGTPDQVALTFDDGPDPQTTPLVLDALREAGVRGTFFMLATQVRAHPDLARRVQAEGHEIAAHGELHRHAWTRLPWGVPLDVTRSVCALQDVTGERVKYYRPPHGAYTLATVLALRAARLTGAHWTIEAHDWHEAYDPGDVEARVLAHVQPGSVIVMHDAGRGGRTAASALPGLLRELKVRGYAPVPLGELGGLRPETPRDLPPRAFQMLDHAFDRFNGVQRTGVRAGSFLRAGVAPFPIDTHPLHPRGTPMLEMHVDSPRLVNASTRPLRALRDVHASVRELAVAVRDRPEWQDVPGAFSIGPFSDILEPLGFEVHDVPPAMRRRLTLWTGILRRVYGAANGPARQAQLTFISREELLRRHAKEPRAAKR